MMRRLVIATGLLFLVACEEMVDPVLETERPYTLFGYLDPSVATQAVRVFSIEPVLARTGLEPLEAQVTLTPTAGGTPVAFRDSVVVYRNGAVGHVFHAAYTPDFGGQYTLSALAPDGRETTVSLRMPERASLELGDASGVLGNVRMPVSFRDAEQVLSPRVLYTFSSDVIPFSWTIPVVYETTTVQQTENMWSFAVDLSRDIGVLYSVTGLQPGINPLTLTHMDVEAFIATAEWTPPEGDYDPELLVQPGTFSNVENGFGFVGAGYRESSRTLPDAAILRLAGFANQ